MDVKNRAYFLYAIRFWKRKPPLISNPTQLPSFWNSIWLNSYNVIDFFDWKMLQPRIPQIVSYSDW